jgi:hypothetical protein
MRKSSFIRCHRPAFARKLRYGTQECLCYFPGNAEPQLSSVEIQSPLGTPISRSALCIEIQYANAEIGVPGGERR